MGFINRLVGESSRSSVGVGYRHSATAPASDNVWPLLGRQIRIGQRIVGVRVAVWPTIHSNGRDVLRGIETASAQHTGELIANLQLKLLEAGGKQLLLAVAILLREGGRACWDSQSCERGWVRPAW